MNMNAIHSAAEGVASVASVASAAESVASEFVDVEKQPTDGDSLLHVENEYTRRVEAEREASLKVCSCGVHCRLFGNIDVNQSWRCLNKDSLGVLGIWPLLGACLAIPACVLTEVSFNNEAVDENVKTELSQIFHFVQPTSFSVRTASIGFLAIDLIITGERHAGLQRAHLLGGATPLLCRPPLLPV